VWIRWFQNLGCGERFDENKKTMPTDFSLPMAIGLQNFRSWRNEGSKIMADRYKSTKVPARIKDHKPPPKTDEMPDAGEAEIRRSGSWMRTHHTPKSGCPSSQTSVRATLLLVCCSGHCGRQGAG
jgi:hypothetical protein